MKPEKFQQIAALIQPGSYVLDMGCGSGGLAPLLTAKGCKVDGMDIAPIIDDENRSSYQNFELGDIEKINFGEKKFTYDVVVFSDVLEHIRNPEMILSGVSSLLNNNGKVLISLPNVAYFSNRWDLFCGRWEYADHGILDRTHLRFFTLSTGKQWIQKCGYSIHKTVPEIPIITSEWKRSLFSILSDLFPSLFAIGWIFEAVKNGEQCR